MGPSVQATSWGQEMPPSSDTIVHDRAMSYQPQTLCYASDLSEVPEASPPPGLVLLDEPSLSSNENVSPKSAFKSGRRTLRRPNPVAIPNLTKKARGRPVPTKDTLLKPGSGRVYACPVEDCRKLFTRSEHLKRHTRSIHTNEKREYPPSAASRRARR